MKELNNLPGVPGRLLFLLSELGLGLLGFEFEFEFGGPGSEPYMGNFADVNHVEHNKLRMPLWLDQTNNIPLQ